MRIDHPIVTIRRKLSSLEMDAKVAQSATSVFESVWSTFESEQYALLLGVHDFNEIQTLHDNLAKFLEGGLLSLGESAPSMLPGKRCWRRDDEEPPPRSHLMSLLDVLGFLSIYVSEDGFIEISLLGESS